MVAATAMAAQSYLQQKQQQPQQQFLPRFPTGSPVDGNPFAAVTAPALFAPDTNLTFAAAMTLPQHFPPQPQLVIPCATTSTCITATAPVPSAKRRRGEDDGINDASVIGRCLATTDLQHVDAEVDALLWRHQASLRAGLERSARRHCRELMLALAREARSRIKAVDAELEAATRRNAELEVRVKQMAAESQAWFAIARDNEAAVAALRAGLEQAMGVANQIIPLGGGVVDGDADEGFGERVDINARTSPADDAESGCFGSAPTGDHINDATSVRGWCRPCRRRRGDRYAVVSAASVVLLPCRHLCLCSDCDRAGTDACPVCGSAKTASIHVIFP